MGPVTLFDKSFLQSLSLDESVWFDYLFPPVICPLFYVETLADLRKPGLEGDAARKEVRVIADKFPDLNGTPCTHHRRLCVANFLGHEIPLTGQVPVEGGRWVETEQRVGTIFDKSPEAEAFFRWQAGEFSWVEHSFAHSWREALSTLDLDEVAGSLRSLDINAKNIRSIKEAKGVALNVVSDRANHFDRMKLAMLFLGVPAHYHERIMRRWKILGYPSLLEFAPFSAHVVMVEAFFQVALAANLIGTKRASNRVDIAYLFYLPFCMAFVSSDKLHRRCSPEFLRKNQRFIWGPDLKNSLRKVNSYYLDLFGSRAEEGILALVDGPPQDVDTLASKVWDELLPGWRENTDASSSRDSRALVAELNEFMNAEEAVPGQISRRSGDLDAMAFRRRVRPRKGSWWQVPAAIVSKTED